MAWSIWQYAYIAVHVCLWRCLKKRNSVNLWSKSFVCVCASISPVITRTIAIKCANHLYAKCKYKCYSYRGNCLFKWCSTTYLFKRFNCNWNDYSAIITVLRFTAEVHNHAPSLFSSLEVPFPFSHYRHQEYLPRSQWFLSLLNRAPMQCFGFDSFICTTRIMCSGLSYF